MKRKLFSVVVSSVVLVVAASMVFAGGQSESSKAAKVMKVGHQMNPEHAEHKALEYFKKIVEEKTGGSVKIELFPSDQLGSFFTQIQNMQQGIQQAHVNGLGWPGHFIPEFYLFNTAFAFRGFAEYAKAINGPVGMEIRERLIKNHGIRLLSVGDWRRGARHLLSTRPILTVEEVRDLKIRVPESPSYIASWKALGAKPTPVAFGEVYLALQQKVVDSMECPLDLIFSQKFFEVAKNISLTSHLPELVAFGIAEKFWQSLSQAEQKIVEEAVAEAGRFDRQIVEKGEGQIKEQMIKTGVVFHEVDANAFWQKGQNAAYDLESQGIWPKGFYDRIAASIK